MKKKNFFETEDEVTHSSDFPGILIGCKKLEYLCAIPVDANVVVVESPREVALEAMVLTNSLHGVSQRDAVKGPRHDRYILLWADGPKAHWKFS